MTSRSSVRAGGQGPPEGDPDLDLDPDPGTGKGRDRGQGTERGRGRGTEKGPDAAAGDQDPQVHDRDQEVGGAADVDDRTLRAAPDRGPGLGHATAGVAGEVTNGGVTAATAIVGVRPLAKRGPETGGGPEARLTPAGAPTQGRGRGAGQGIS